MATSDASSIVLMISARKPDAGSWRAIIEIGLDTYATLFSFSPQVNGTITRSRAGYSLPYIWSIELSPPLSKAAVGATSIHAMGAVCTAPPLISDNNKRGRLPVERCNWSIRNRVPCIEVLLLEIYLIPCIGAIIDRLDRVNTSAHEAVSSHLT